MRGLILAAGRGTRMGALTADRPKGLVQLGGRSLIARAVEALKRGGCAEVAIVTGYRHELVAPLTDTSFHNPRWAETNMVASLQTADAWLRAGPVVVSYSDIFYSTETVTALARCESAIAIAYDPFWRRLWEERFGDPLSDAESFRLDSHGFLTEIGRKNASYADIEGQYMGLLKFTPQSWRQIVATIDVLPAERRDRLDMTSLLALLIRESVRIQAVPREGAWGECDSESDYRLYRRWFGEAQTCEAS